MIQKIDEGGRDLQALHPFTGPADPGTVPTGLYTVFSLIIVIFAVCLSFRVAQTTQIQALKRFEDKLCKKLNCCACGCCACLAVTALAFFVIVATSMDGNCIIRVG